MREIVALFAQQESRDALSDLLFPRTSVIQTGARYFPMVPWHLRMAESKGIARAQTTGWVQCQERRLVEVLRDDGALQGLIGRPEGPTVKILPSTIYWSGYRWASRHG